MGGYLRQIDRRPHDSFACAVCDERPEHVDAAHSCGESTGQERSVCASGTGRQCQSSTKYPAPALISTENCNDEPYHRQSYHKCNRRAAASVRLGICTTSRACCQESSMQILECCIADRARLSLSVEACNPFTVIVCDLWGWILSRVCGNLARNGGARRHSPVWLAWAEGHQPRSRRNYSSILCYLYRSAWPATV